MRKVSNPTSSPLTTATTRATETPITTAEIAVEDPFTNGKADAFNLKDAELDLQLRELQGDAATLERVPQAVDRLMTIFGTARAKPVPGENGYADYVWGESLGEELRQAGYSISTGAGPGAMEAPLRGHAARDAELDMKAGRAIGWEPGEPTVEGGNIILPHEQAANPYIPAESLSSFNRFTFRMQFLFRDNVRPKAASADAVPLEQPRGRLHVPERIRQLASNLHVPGLLKRLAEKFHLKRPDPMHTSPKLATPGGYGTIAEMFTYLAMRSHGQATEPLLFGSHDDFFKRLNNAFMPFMNEREKPELRQVYQDPKKLVRDVQRMPPAERKIDPADVVPRMRDDLERGLNHLDGKPSAVAFFAGAGPRTAATLPALEKIAEGVAGAGKAVRVSGSPIADDAVMRGVLRANPDAEIQAFALDDSEVQDHGALQYTRVRDVLVLRELMDTKVDAIVTTPEGAKQIALLFTVATDMQTGKMKKLPIIVLDPDGKFKDLKEELGKILMSSERKYINPEDLDLFTITNDPAEALRAINAPAVAVT